MYEIDKMIVGYKEQLNDILNDICTLQHAIIEKLQNKANLEKFIESLEKIINESEEL